MNKPFLHSSQFIDQLKDIELKISQQQLQQAASQLNDLAKNSSHDPRLFLLGARLAQASENQAGTLTAARRAHELAPNWAVATIFLAGVLADQEQSAQAISTAQLAIDQAKGRESRVDVLTRAADVARKVHRNDQALNWLRQAEPLAPEDSGIGYKIGILLMGAEDMGGAIEIFSRLLDDAPINTRLLQARMFAAIYNKQFDLASSDAEFLVTLEPENTEHQIYLAICQGSTPDVLPGSLILDLFDDAHLRRWESLTPNRKNTLPADAAALVRQWFPDNVFDVLDLGCGAGELGSLLRPFEGVLVGVDLSASMIGRAARLSSYDSFHQVDLLEALRATPDNLYKVITALDAFVYIGNLDNAIANAHRILMANGHLIFSFAAGAEAPSNFTLTPDLYFTHRRAYVQGLLLSAGFQNITMKDHELLLHGGLQASGFLVSAQKGATLSEKTVRRSPKSAKPARSGK